MNSEVDDTKVLFRCIVTMDYFRILSRLRSRHATKKARDKAKPALITQLNTAIHDQSVQPSSTVTSWDLDNIRTKIKALDALFVKFEDISQHSAVSTEVQDVVMELIIDMHDLTSQMKLRLALQSSSRLEPGLVTFLPDAVEKLARYYSIAHELVCTARTSEYSIFNHIAIGNCTIRPPPQPTTLDKNVHPLTSLQKIVRPRTPVQSRGLKASFEKCLGMSCQDASDQFRFNIAEYYKFVKVHAEIQLLFFYEMNKITLRPRIICSSKSACYLCNLFFKLHGQFYIPRTHGRLYHQWTLPDWQSMLPKLCHPTFAAIVGQFNDVLNVMVKTALGDGLWPSNNPNKSAMLVPAHTQAKHLTIESLATLYTAQTRGQSVEVPISSILDSSSPPHDYASSSIEIADPSSPQPLRQFGTAVASSSSGTPILPLTAQGPASSGDSPPLDASIDFLTPSSQTTSKASSTATQRPYDDLIRDEPDRRQVPYPNISINIGTRRLHLHVSYEFAPAPYPDTVPIPNSHCWVRVKWLQDNDIEAIDSHAVNSEDLAYDAEMKLGNGTTAAPTELHMRRGEDVVSVKYSFGESSEARVGEGRRKEKGGE